MGALLVNFQLVFEFESTLFFVFTIFLTSLDSMLLVFKELIFIMYFGILKWQYHTVYIQPWQKVDDPIEAWIRGTDDNGAFFPPPLCPWPPQDSSNRQTLLKLQYLRGPKVVYSHRVQLHNLTEHNVQVTKHCVT
jgi:hypothetical protein